MKPNRHRLSNGLRIVHIPDEASQMVYVSLLYGVGARDEEYEYTGIAHLLEHLMFEGTPDIPSFDEPLENAGGENNAYTTSDITLYYMSLPKQNAELAFWLESDRMHNIRLTKESVAVQRQVVIEEFKQEHLNYPYGDADAIIRAMAYKVHPYRWPVIGRKPSHIAKVPVQVLRRFYKRYYAPDNAVLAIVGNISFDTVVQWAEKWFSPIPASNHAQSHLANEPRKTRQSRKTVRRNVPQDALYMAFHMGKRTDATFFPCDVLSDILANGYSGRLRTRLVDELRLFTKIDAYISGCEGPGLFRIQGRIAQGVETATAEQAVWNELNRLKNEAVPDIELQKVRNRYESEHIFRNTGGENLSGNLAIAEWRGNVNELFTEVDSYKAVTAQELMLTAKDIFRKGNSCVLHYLRKQPRAIRSPKNKNIKDTP